MTEIPKRNVTPPAPVARAGVQFGKPVTGLGHRVLLYGPGGIGKTTLATNMPGKTVFFDLDESLGRLGVDATTVNVSTWQELRTALQAEGWSGVDNIVIDSVTRAEELAVAHTLATVLHEKGQKVTSVEDYGYGKGLSHVFDTFLHLLVDLDRHARNGRNIIMICHDCVTMVPNPGGEDWQRYEPRLQSPASGKNSIRLRAREWADHVLFLGYDVITKDKKGKGGGSRTLWPVELPFCMAKSRTCRQPVAVGEDGKVWEEIIK